MSITVRRIVVRKPDVHSVTPDTTVLEALGLMAEHNIGALLVMEGDRVVGIFSERDYARKVILKGKSSRDLPVNEIMTRHVLFADPDWTAYDCMGMMTQWHVRHLPVLERGEVVGVVSIGDVVSAVVSEQATTINHLEHYIASGA